MNRIVVIGNSASGKSTLSMRLRKASEFPVYHLDKILWKTGWERTPEEEFTARHNEIISKEKWIIDGVAYKSTYEERFSAAEMIIFLDTPLEICKERALQRMHEDLERPNPYVSEGCPYPLELVDEQNKTIELFHNDYRKEILEMIKNLRETKKVFLLTNDQEVESFFDKIECS